MRRNRWNGVFLYTVLTVCGCEARAAIPQSNLENQALAIIEKRCLSCHSAELKTSGLDLSTRQTALRGGSAGPALKPGPRVFCSNASFNTRCLRENLCHRKKARSSANGYSRERPGLGKSVRLQVRPAARV